MRRKLEKKSSLIAMFSLIALLVLALFFASVQFYNADTTGGAATLSISPGSSEHIVGEEFSVDLVADGGGQNFTSFGADINITNLTVMSLTKGPVSQWIKEPNASSLNFYGAVAGETNHIVIYSLKVKGDEVGEASISISNGNIKAVIENGYKVIDVLSAQNGGKFTIKSTDGGTGGGDTGGGDEKDDNVVDPPNPDPPAVKDTTLNSEVTQTKPKTTTTTPSTTPQSETTPPAETVKQIVAPTMPTDKTSFEKAWLTYKNSGTLPITLSLDKANLKYDSKSNLLGGLIFKGKTSPNILVTIYLFSNQIVKSTTAGADGSWQIAISDLLAGGTHTVYALGTDADGVSARSSKLVFNLNPTEKTISKVTSAKAKAEETKTDTSVKKSIWQTTWFKVGAAVLTIILVICLILLIRRRKTNQQEYNLDNPSNQGQFFN